VRLTREVVEAFDSRLRALVGLLGASLGRRGLLLGALGVAMRAVGVLLGGLAVAVAVTRLLQGAVSLAPSLAGSRERLIALLLGLLDLGGGLLGPLPGVAGRRLGRRLRGGRGIRPRDRVLRGPAGILRLRRSARRAMHRPLIGVVTIADAGVVQRPA
jgi:hypothetical protein